MAPPPPLPSLKRTTRDVAEIYSSTPWNIPSSADREFTGRYCPYNRGQGSHRGWGRGPAAGALKGRDTAWPEMGWQRLVIGHGYRCFR